MPYQVIVYDNYHFMDPEEAYHETTFDHVDDALRYCWRIVDDFLASAMEPGMSVEELYSQYVNFGEDPVVHAVDAPPVLFSAWGYARTQAEQLVLSGRQAGHLDVTAS